jgi:hypothetical protein
LIRMQIQMTESQAEAVREAARREGVSQAEIVRRALLDYLAGAVRPDRKAARVKALAAMGSVRTDLTDLSERHDDYFAEAAELDSR